VSHPELGIRDGTLGELAKRPLAPRRQFDAHGEDKQSYWPRRIGGSSLRDGRQDYDPAQVADRINPPRCR
jgi:hypothetical protein